MEKLCKNCKYWEKQADNEIRKDGLGICKSKKFRYMYDIDIYPIDGLVYWDADYYEAGIFVGQDFGCIHWKKKKKS